MLFKVAAVPDGFPHVFYGIFQVLAGVTEGLSIVS